MLLQRLIRTSWLLGTCVVVLTNGLGGHGTQQQGERPKDFHDPSFTQDEAHLKEHLKDEINIKDKMTPEEMEFHYFRLHDTNNDTHLDGTEILQAMSHVLPVPELQLHEKLGKSKEQIAEIMADRQNQMMKYYEEMIDRVLFDDDVDKDGYLTYSEFVRARRRDEFHHRKAQEEAARAQEMQQFEQFKQFQAMQAQHGQQQQQQQGRIPPPPPPSQ